MSYLRLKESMALTGPSVSRKNLSMSSEIEFEQFQNLDPDTYKEESYPFEKIKIKSEDAESKIVMQSSEKRLKVEHLVGTIVLIEDDNVILEIEKNGTTINRNLRLTKLQQITKSHISPGDIVLFVNISDGISSFTTIKYRGRAIFSLDSSDLASLEESYNRATKKE